MAIRGQRHWIRRWLRRVGIGVAVLLLLTPPAGIALHHYGRACFARATSDLEALLGEELDFDFAHLETPPLPRYENAAEQLLDGFEALDVGDGELDRINQAWLLARRGWPSELEASIRTLIARNHLGLETMHQAAAIERSSYGIRYRDGAGADRRNVGFFVWVAKLLNIEGRLALADGDVDGGLAAAGALARIATSLDQEHWLFFLLYEMAVERSLNRLVLEILEETEPWAASSTLLAEIEALLPTRDWLEKFREYLILEGSMYSVNVRYGDKTLPHGKRTPPSIRYLFGHLVAAEALVGTGKSVELIPLSYGKAQDRFIAASGQDAESLNLLYDMVCETFLYHPPSPLQSLVGMPIMIGRMLAAVPHSTARNASANSWGRRRSVLLVIQEIAAERQLIHAAMTLRRDALARGNYPRERPALAALAKPDPMTGRLISYRPGDDGCLRLELEGGLKLAQERWGGRSWREKKETRDRVEIRLRGKVFAVTLPPIGRRLPDENLHL